MAFVLGGGGGGGVGGRVNAVMREPKEINSQTRTIL